MLGVIDAVDMTTIQNILTSKNFISVAVDPKNNRVFVRLNRQIYLTLESGSPVRLRKPAQAELLLLRIEPLWRLDPSGFHHLHLRVCSAASELRHGPEAAATAGPARHSAH